MLLLYFLLAFNLSSQQMQAKLEKEEKDVLIYLLKSILMLSAFAFLYSLLSFSPHFEFSLGPGQQH